MRVKLGVAMLAGALLATPLTVLATHTFSDVPNSNPFHDDISAVADSGIAQGFTDGTYKPANAVTRQAMAAFLERGLGRAGSERNSQVMGSANGVYSAVVASVDVDAGAEGTGTRGLYVLMGTANAHTGTASSCPCQISLNLGQDGQTFTAVTTIFDVPVSSDETGRSYAMGSIHYAVPINGDQRTAFQLIATLTDATAASVTVDGQLTAIYVPFGPDGDNTSEYETDCIGTESESNDTIPTADPMPASGCLRGSAIGSNPDVFSFGVASGQILTIETRSLAGAGCGGDTKLTLMSASSSVLAMDDDFGVGTCSRIVMAGLATGTYYARLEPYAASSAVRYQFVVTLSPTNAVEETGDVDDISKD
jgi:hypothetical protein